MLNEIVLESTRLSDNTFLKDLIWILPSVSLFMLLILLVLQFLSCLTFTLAFFLSSTVFIFFILAFKEGVVISCLINHLSLRCAICVFLGVV